MSLDDAAIERLVHEAQAGDAWAFGRLFDHYHLPVYRFVASRVRRPSDAEDLTQLVFVKALEALPRYESRGIPFGGWLFRLARNAVIDFVRTSHEHADLAQSVDRADANAGPDELAVTRQEIDAVGTALSTLTEDQRDAIALRFFAGLSAREAAEVMGKQEGTVRGLQFRAIAALRRAARDRGAGDHHRDRPTRASGDQLMDDLMFRRDDPRDPEIERLLEAYAELRLSPSVAATTRMRAGVMAAAHRRAALLQADATTGRHRCDSTRRASASPAPLRAGADRRPRSSPPR